MGEINEKNVMPSLFPELLSLEELQKILQKKWPKLKQLNQLTLDEAIQLYRKMLLPLPQRQYSRNSRGRLLHKRRLRCGLEPSDSEISSSSSNDQPKKRKLAGDTLKLTPDTGNLNSTRISLANIKTTTKQNTTALQNLVINKRSSSTSESELCDSAPNNNSVSHNKCDETPSKPKKVKITWP